MAWLISALGAALALGGAMSLGYGSYFIRMDWGQAETVAGTVALAGGLVTVALGAVLSALRDLAQSPARAGSSGIGLEAPAGRDGDEPASQRALRRFKSKLATVGMPRVRPAATEPAVVGPAASDLAAPPSPVPVSSVRASSMPAPPMPVARDLDAPLRPTFPPEPEPVATLPPIAMTVDAPTVVGRYEANGASYVLFSDGTIEVETETGTHRFASMAELKDHIERQDVA